jgi:hypothetical protein
MAKPVSPRVQNETLDNVHRADIRKLHRPLSGARTTLPKGANIFALYAIFGIAPQDETLQI